jgi:polyhydroxybutyrate depolymerase
MSTTRSIIFAGLERTYRIHMPPSYDKSTPLPLLIALHGGGGSGEKMEELTLRGFNRLSDKEGFIVVYPDGIEKHWNDGRENVKYRAHREKIDDVGFISALIDYLVKQYNIDIKQVYATGISNGAMMSFRLGCELSEKIAAIAPVAGSMPENLPTRCSPSRSISVLIISNTEDPLVPWGGWVSLKLEKWTPGFNGFMVIFERSVVGFVGMWVPQSGIQVIVGSVVKS